MSETKTIVITGCTKGLGRAMARGFAAAGHCVAGCGRSAGELAKLSGELGLPHLISVADVLDAAAVSSFARLVLEKFGPPDLLVNNAALINRNAPLWEVPEEEFSRVIDVNLKGIHLVLRQFLPHMVRRGSGIVVNFSSGWGRSTSPEVAPYCCTKWGVEGLTKSLAQELPNGMAAVALNPGVIDTDMLRSCFGGGAAGCLSPEEWAQRAVPFLLALKSRQNGESLNVP